MKTAYCVLLFACLLPLFVVAAAPRLYIPLDASAAVFGEAGEELRPGVVHGRADYLPGVSGHGLNVTRHAYDQVTACEFSALPAMDLNTGSLAFWFKPHWRETDEGSRRIINFNAGPRFRLYMVKSGKRRICRLAGY